MEAEYELTVDDIVAFNVHHRKASPTIRRVGRLALIIVLFAIALIGISTITGKDAPAERASSGVIWLVVLIGVIFIFAYQSRYGFAKIVRRMLGEGLNVALLCRRRVAIDRDAISVVSEYFERKTRWPAVEKVVETGDYLFIYLSSVQAEIVPRRAFADESRFRSFVEAAKRYYRAAGGMEHS